MVHIHYLRLPAREEVFRQYLVRDEGGVKVTFAQNVLLPQPLEIDSKVVLEPGSDAVWFTFDDAWHDIGRFHAADGTFTGIYANILTPPEFEAGHLWRTTDLFLDVWLPPDGVPRVLDREEFDAAVEAGWIDERTRIRALEEVDRILEAISAARWPPPIVEDWTVERVRTLVAEAAEAEAT